MLLTKEEFSKVSEQIRDTFIGKIEEDMQAEGKENFWWNKFKWCRTEYFPCVVSPILRFNGKEEIDHFLKFKELPSSMEKIGIGALDNTCVDEFRKMLGYPTVPSGTIEDIVKHQLESPYDPTFDQPVLLTVALFTEDSEEGHVGFMPTAVRWWDTFEDAKPAPWVNYEWVEHHIEQECPFAKYVSNNIYTLSCRDPLAAKENINVWLDVFKDKNFKAYIQDIHTLEYVDVRHIGDLIFADPKAGIASLF